MDMYTLLYLKWVTNKDILYSIRNSLLNVVSQSGQERSLGENGYVCVWLSPFTVHLKLSQHC